MPARIIEEDPCLLPKVVGTCRASIRRYFFDKDTGNCQGFFYGGCNGNENNFMSKEDCQTSCQAHMTRSILQQQGPPAICSQPVDAGPCKAFNPRFFYNSDTGKCQGFIYGGCRGNENNFETLNECQDACGEGRRRPKLILLGK